MVECPKRGHVGVFVLMYGCAMPDEVGCREARGLSVRVCEVGGHQADGAFDVELDLVAVGVLDEGEHDVAAEAEPGGALGVEIGEDEASFLPACDGLMQALQGVVLVGQVGGADILGVELGEHQKEHARGVLAALEEPDVVAKAGAHRLARIIGVGLELAIQASDDARRGDVDGLGEEGALGAKVAVDERLGDASLLGDAPGGGAMVRVLGEDRDGAAQDL